MFAASRAARRGASKGSRAMSSLGTPAAPVYYPSVFEKMFYNSKMPQVPLNKSFPNSPAITATQVPFVSEAKVTTMANGLRVAALDSSSPVVSAGVFIDSGSRHETQDTQGVSHFLETMSFTTNPNNIQRKLVQDMSALGANVHCSTSRDLTRFTAECLPEHASTVLGVLADELRMRKNFDEIERRDAVEQYKILLDEVNNTADIQMMDAIHSAAYGNRTLGLSQYAPAAHLDLFTSDFLSAHMQKAFNPSRMVLAAVGLSHAELQEIADQSFSNIGGKEGIAKDEEEKAVYLGGDVRLDRRGDSSDGLTHVALGFESAHWNSDDLLPVCVLQMMMGGGGSFSAGGPGKGMYSRLYTNVLNQHQWVESASSFNSIYLDSSIFGMYGTAVPEYSGQLVEVLAGELLRMTEKLAPGELDRATTQLKSSMAMQLEQRAFQLEDVGTQLLTYDRVMSLKEVCQKVEAVTEADVQRVAQKMLKTPLSFSAFGNTSYLPRYDTVANAFRG